jgi:hypothetical protein
VHFRAVAGVVEAAIVVTVVVKTVVKTAMSRGLVVDASPHIACHVLRA